jgi:hypothetical protein
MQVDDYDGDYDYAWKLWRYDQHCCPFNFEQPPEIEAEGSDCVFRDGLGNRWGQKMPTGPSRKRLHATQSVEGTFVDQKLWRSLAA